MTLMAAQAAYRRALDAQRRAIGAHDTAADLQQRLGRLEVAARERAAAEREREKLAEAELRHPEWV